MGKKILLVGSGAREHALAARIKASPELDTLFVAPGNAGTGAIATNVPIAATDVLRLLEFVRREKVNFTVIGPDDPLARGIVDVFQAHGLRIFGPRRAAARIESSKIYAKRLMRHTGVLSAPSVMFNGPVEALSVVQEHFNNNEAKSIVLKADGLALGKGVYVCRTLAEAEQAIDELMFQRVHGSAGELVVAEDFVEGPEISVHAFCDGTRFSMFPFAQDHKPLYNGNTGPMTGGMGVIAPAPWFSDGDLVSKKIISPTLVGLQNEGHPFVGCLYPGLKISKEGPVVLEFNARFGDPETQAYMRLLSSDLLEILEACVDGTLSTTRIEWSQHFVACIVLASAGYPSPHYKKGAVITGIEEAERLAGVKVFHAGTSLEDNVLRTTGGRVLSVTGLGSTLKEAIDQAYRGIDLIHFPGMQFRSDIGASSLKSVS